MLRHAARPRARWQWVSLPATAAHRSGRGPSPSPPPHGVTPSQDPTVASPRRDRFKRGRGPPLPRLLSLLSPVPRPSTNAGQAARPLHCRCRGSVLCCAFAGVAPMPKLADAAAHLLLPASPPAAASFLSLAHGIAGASHQCPLEPSAATPVLRSVSCLPPSEPLR
jgi:hypothetical protein